MQPPIVLIFKLYLVVCMTIDNCLGKFDHLTPLWLEFNNGETHAELLTQTWLNYSLCKETEFYKAEDGLMRGLVMPSYYILGSF